jgi:hypothetical protein
LVKTCREADCEILTRGCRARRDGLYQCPSWTLHLVEHRDRRRLDTTQQEVYVRHLVLCW